MVVTPQDVAHLDAKKALTMYRTHDVPVLGGVENMSGLLCPCCDNRIEVFPPCAHERTIWATGVEQLAAIPMQPGVAAAGESGTPAVLRDGADPLVLAAFADLAAALRRRLRGGRDDG
jgi:ATP-binding protein involved in chromosome partitioning